MRLAKVLGVIGRTLITSGVLILLFVAYQLWGTGIRESQAQSRLEDQFTEALDAAPASTSTSAPPDTSTTTLPVTTTSLAPVEPVAEGDPAARIRIPRIGVDKIVVEGVSLGDLKKGPGHYPTTPLPGQQGNAAIAGHRTTYGAPFNRIDELAVGDEIFVETVQGSFRYVVSAQQIVAPTQVDVLDDKGDSRLTLTACHPKYSARQRIVVVAQLAPDEVALPRPARPATAAPPALDSIDGAGAPALPAIVLGFGCAAIWLLAWLLGRRWRKWPAYGIGLPFFLVGLFYFFEEFSRLLPSNF
ncbi:MAG: class E sortase [Acidimicrobiales bacterium]